MTTRHSPPNTPLSVNAVPLALRVVTEAVGSSSLETPERTIPHHGSAPDLYNILSNVTERKKRKFAETDSSTSALMRDMFASFSKEQEKRFDDLQSTILELKEQNVELTLSVDMMSKKYDEFLEKIVRLESERKEDKKTIKELEERIESMERKTRATGIEIRNIPKNQGENKDELCKTVQKVLKSLDIDVQANEIRDTFRMKSKDSTNPIVAEFTSVLIKDRVLRGVKDFNKNKSNKDKLNTTHIGIPEPTKPIFISETLTNKTQRLYYLARQFQKAHEYDFCWTSQGMVYLREKEKLPQIRILSEADLEALKTQ